MKKRKQKNKSSESPIGTIEDFEQRYLPKQSKEDAMKRLTAKEFGEELARDTIEIVRRVLAMK